MLIIYNICGLANQNNLHEYKESLDSIRLDADDSLVISSCGNQPETLWKLKKWYPHAEIIHTDEKLAVNVTFNLAAQKFTKPDTDSYLYMASDVVLQEESLLKLKKVKAENPDYGMIALKPDVDSGYQWWFGHDINELFEVPIGKTCNLHCQLFSGDILDYFGGILPDLFTSYCSESIFSFINASLHLRFLIDGANVVRHKCTMDGACSAFGRAWDLVYPGSPPISEIISNPLAYEVGLGYEEWRQKEGHAGFLIHNPDKFDGVFAKDFRLASFIRDNFYLTPSILDYNKIQYEIL